MSFKTAHASRLDTPNVETVQRLLDHPKVRLGLFVLSLALGLLYVIQMNLTATKGYDIRELEQSIASLQKESRQLELEAMELQSVERIMEQLATTELVKANPDVYVAMTSSTVASR